VKRNKFRPSRVGRGRGGRPIDTIKEVVFHWDYTGGGGNIRDISSKEVELKEKNFRKTMAQKNF